MSEQVVGAIGMVSILVLIFLRIPVAICMGLVGFFGYAALEGWGRAATVLGSAPFDIASGYALSIVPLFVLMGELSSASGMSSRLFQGTSSLFGTLRGSLAYASIGASAAFGAVCGSSVASAATMTRICVPEMRRHGYDDRLSIGSVAAGGTIGILVPPSLILVIYAMITQQSVPKLFAAGLIPGVVLTALYIIAAAVVLLVKPGWAPKGKARALRQRIVDVLGMWEFVLLFGVSVGGIYAGLFSPTEAAAIGTFLALLSGVAQGRLDFAKLWQCFEATLRTTSMLFMIIVCAIIFSYFVVQAQLPTALIAWTQKMALSPMALMLTLIVCYIILGCFLEGIGLVLITVPVFLPVVVRRDRGARGRTRPDPPAGRHESFRDPGADPRSADPGHLQGDATLPRCPYRTHRDYPALPGSRALPADCPLREITSCRSSAAACARGDLSPPPAASP
jgi:C4-dicarboxylate transporter DctM subunit